MNRDARYTVTVLLLTAAVLAPIVVLNYVVGVYVLTNEQLPPLAHEWQTQTRGTVSVSPGAELRFKRLALRDRLASIDTLVLGSSTLTTVQAVMIGHAAGGDRFYNFTVSNNGSRLIAGDADFVVDEMPSVRLVIVGLDWATAQGIFVEGEARRREGGLTRDPESEQVSVWEQLSDTLTWPRTVQLYGLLKGWLRGEPEVRDLRNLRDAPAYCPGDGTCPSADSCRDFDTSGMLRRHACLGFRWDGSVNISAYGHFARDENAKKLMDTYSATDGYGPMMAARGIPNRLVLDSLARSARRLRQQHREMIVVLPPMLPHLAEELARRPSTAEYVTRVRTELAQWAEREGMHVIDANASEAFGCGFEDFFDNIHAGPACFEKVLASLRR